MVARGEIWWYEPPDDKRRPYLVISRNEAIPLLTTVLAVPATGRLRGIPAEVRLGKEDGMPAECALSFDNLRWVRKAMLTRRITALPTHRWLEVCGALRFTVAC